ncbi:MAG: molybdenum cofactor guanylyltransferase MobA [Hyphomicrobiaceae bacterium]
MSRFENVDVTVAAGFILAGGLSRRMFADGSGHGDKGLLPIGSRSMLAHVAASLGRQTDTVVLNANGDPARFASLGLPVIADTVAGHVGPLAGILAGLRWAAARESAANGNAATHLVSVSTDTPFFPDDLVTSLIAALQSATGGERIAIARSAGQIHPVIGLWPLALVDDLEQALQNGVRRVNDWAARHGTIVVDFPYRTIGGRVVDPFFNANTPEDLEVARTLAAALGGS